MKFLWMILILRYCCCWCCSQIVCMPFEYKRYLYAFQFERFDNFISNWRIHRHSIRTILTHYFVVVVVVVAFCVLSVNFIELTLMNARHTYAPRHTHTTLNPNSIKWYYTTEHFVQFFFHWEFQQQRTTQFGCFSAHPHDDFNKFTI